MSNAEDQIHTGILQKWTNYVKGYKNRWFVLENGYLTYYRSEAESTTQPPRSTIALADATVVEQGSRGIIIHSEGRSTHLKTTATIDRDRWIKLIRQAAEKARRAQAEDTDNVLRTATDEIHETLAVARTHRTTIKEKGQQVDELHASLRDQLLALSSAHLSNDVRKKVHAIVDVADTMMKSSSEVVEASEKMVLTQSTLEAEMNQLLEQVYSGRLELEHMLEDLGRQHQKLEQKLHRLQSTRNRRNRPQIPWERSRVDGDDEENDDEDEYYDALEDDAFDILTISLPRILQGGIGAGGAHTVRDSVNEMPADDDASTDSDSDEGEGEEGRGAVHIHIVAKKRASKLTQGMSNAVSATAAKRGSRDTSTGAQSPGGATQKQRRTTIPPKPFFSASIWSILKNAVGKDMTKIALPVGYSEPLSFLQRLTEDLDYSDCLDAAAELTTSDDRCFQLAQIAAFVVSAYSNTIDRLQRPFNPLLGETFEFDRRSDLGWRSVGEQVSHHPPVSAIYSEGKEWNMWQQFTLKTNFRGNYMRLEPQGMAQLSFPKTGDHYIWRKVDTYINNIIIGQLWIDHNGETKITNCKTDDRCQLIFHPHGTTKKNRQVTGIVYDSTGHERYLLTGTWDERLEAVQVLSSSKSLKTKHTTVTYNTSAPVVLWQRRYPPPELEKCYHFTQLAVEMNEPESGVAPTDSRLRPDQRLLEQGKTTEADHVKFQLEQKQRNARAKLADTSRQPPGPDNAEANYRPKWFKEELDKISGEMIHQFTGEYWDCKDKKDWSRCPDIFL